MVQATDSAPTETPSSRTDRRPRRGRLLALASELAFLAMAAIATHRALPRESKRPAAPVAEPAPTAPVRLRRLTREEYNHAVRDVFGDDSRPADAFPADEVVAGFESNTVAPVTRLLVEHYVAAAESVAARAVERLDRLAPCTGGRTERDCAQEFVGRFGRLSYRRTLTEDEQASLLRLYEEKARSAGHAAGIRLVVAALLQSPKFLYRLELPPSDGAPSRPLDGPELATRLASLFWATTPDHALLDEAEAGALATVDGVARVARKMLADPRFVEGVRNFHRQWLGLDELASVSRDAVLHPSFTPELKAAMIEETLRFAAHATLAGGDAVTNLLTGTRSFVNAPLAKLYGIPTTGTEGFTLVELPRGERAGLLTQASLMTLLATSEQSSPVHRGKFVRERLLCQAIPPPPPGAVIAAPHADPKVPTKKRFARHRTDPNCAGCHEKMDPIGFGFEHYDPIGSWRTADGENPVDAVGKLDGTRDADGEFDGAIALAERLAKSNEVRRCVATQWFRAAIGRGERPEDATSLDAVQEAFARAGFDVRELLVALATSEAFRTVRFAKESDT